MKLKKYYEVWYGNEKELLEMRYDANGSGNKKKCQDWFLYNGGKSAGLYLVYNYID